MFPGHGPAVGGVGIGPGQKVVDAALGMAVDDAGDDVGQVGVRVDVVELAGFDERGDGRPVLGAAVGADEERILAIEGERISHVPSYRAWGSRVRLIDNPAAFIERNTVSATAVASLWLR